MQRTTVVRTAVAGAVAGVGLAVGGVAIATADEQPSDAPSATDRDNDPGDSDERSWGPGHRGWFAGGDRFAEQLAEELGVEQAEVEQALEAVREELEENRPDWSGLSPDEIREELRTRMREQLVDRLDDAVEDGTLTEQDRESVLKAFDAGVIGGLDGFRHRGPDTDDPEDSES